MIEELINKFPQFSFVKRVKIKKNNTFTMTHEFLSSQTEQIYPIQVLFIGKTGYGKSTTLNRIVGQEVFETDDVCSCTKEMYEVSYCIDKKKKTFLTFNDMPGIGESLKADEQYYEWYENMISCSECIVYVLRADQRDYSWDDKVFRQFLKKCKKQVIIALNCADKIEPINRHEGLSTEQILNLKAKVKRLSTLFGIPQKNIVYYSAKDEINMGLLMEKIAYVISDSMENH